MILKEDVKKARRRLIHFSDLDSFEVEFQDLVMVFSLSGHSRHAPLADSDSVPRSFAVEYENPAVFRD